jgi:hypothetical protein
LSFVILRDAVFAARSTYALCVSIGAARES